MISIVRPHGDVDSNEHRAVLRIIGARMIHAHLLLGVGPEQVGKQYENYIPPEVARPLPTGYYGHLHNIYYQYAAERGATRAGDSAVVPAWGSVGVRESASWRSRCF